MTINLSKGETISLTKESGPAGLNHVVVGLGWDPIEAHPPYDLDASAFLTDALNRCAAPTDFVFYNAPRHPSGSVNCGDDSRDGSGDGDDESLDIQLALVPPTVEKIRVVVSIDQAQIRGHHFGGVQNAVVRVADQGSGVELARFSLSQGAAGQDCLVFGELYRVGPEWHFRAVGDFVQGGLGAALAIHGLA